MRRRVVTYGALLLAVLSFGGALSGTVLSLRAIQDSRYDATYRSCLSRNEEHVAIVGFVSTSAPGLRRRAQAAFPIVKDCESYANSRVR